MQLRRSLWILCITLGSVVGSALAQHMNAADAPCQGARSEADGTQCFYEASKKADADLNRFYSLLRQKLSGEDLEKLQVAQRLWLQFRAANCGAERELYTGGSAAPKVYLACVEADTRERTKELKTMYEWRLDK